MSPPFGNWRISLPRKKRKEKEREGKRGGGWRREEVHQRLPVMQQFPKMFLLCPPALPLCLPSPSVGGSFWPAPCQTRVLDDKIALFSHPHRPFWYIWFFYLELKLAIKFLSRTVLGVCLGLRYFCEHLGSSEGTSLLQMAKLGARYDCELWLLPSFCENWRDKGSHRWLMCLLSPPKHRFMILSLAALEK